MNTIFARPTLYRGTQMRSRLEAAWAEQFDALGWAWEYEPVCLAGPSGQYLPDFRVRIDATSLPVYFEVKGAWWESPVMFGQPMDTTGDGIWERIYEATFDGRRNMSQLVFEHDPQSVFVLAHQHTDDDHLMEAWWPNRPTSMPTSANICVCPSGCTGFVSSSGTVCVEHHKPWADATLVPSLHGQQYRRRDFDVDDFDLVMRMGRRS